jgi:hypothetical protein
MNKHSKRKIKALKQARKLIADRSEEFICYALGSVRAAHPKLTEAANDLQVYIMRELGYFSTLDSWQWANLPDGRHSPYQRRADRIAWIDWMIEQLQNSSDSSK